MTRYLLDTNIPSEVTKPSPEPNSKRRSQLERWLEYDVHKWLAGRILPVTEAIAECWGKLEAKRQRLGMPLNTADGQIAATALEHGLTVVTRNVSDFRELGVEILDPFAA